MTKSLKTERSSIIGVERLGFGNVLLITAHFGSWRARSTLTLGLPRHRITAIWGQFVYSIAIVYRREERDDVFVNKRANSETQINIAAFVRCFQTTPSPCIIL